MKDIIRSRINMGDGIANALTTHEPEWILKPAFAVIVAIFRAIKLSIDELLLITERIDTGITVDKSDSKNDLIAKGYRISRAVHTFAQTTDDDSLADSVNIPLSSLRAMDDVPLKSFMEILLGIAEDNSADLEDYDILGPEITAFEAAITDFAGWKSDPLMATAERKDALTKLEAKVGEMMDVLNERMDPAMYLFENSGTAFYGVYSNLRNIIEPGGANAETQNGINPIETDTIINLPFTNLGAGKEVRIKCLTPGTNFEIYCSNAPSVPPTGTPLSINDVISPIYTTTDDLGWLPDSPYVNIHFPPLPVEIEWEVRVG